MSRVCIIAKDIQIITGKSERQSRNILAQIKVVLNKQKHQEVTVSELCDYLGLKKEDILQFIR
jgi:ribosomal silencing factor RsfS